VLNIRKSIEYGPSLTAGLTLHKQEIRPTTWMSVCSSTEPDVEYQLLQSRKSTHAVGDRASIVPNRGVVYGEEQSLEAFQWVSATFSMR
jgi:hypothetical protein